MRKIIFLIPTLLLLSGVCRAQKDSVEVILKGYLKFVGGWDKVRTLTTYSRYIISETHSENWVTHHSFSPYSLMYERRTLDSILLEIHCDDEEGQWTVTPGSPIMKMPNRNAKFPRPFPVEFNYPNPLALKAMIAAKIPFELLGREEVGGVMCHKVRAEIGGSFEEFFYFSIQDYALLKAVRKSQSKNYSGEVEYSDYRRVESYMVSFASVVYGKFSPKGVRNELQRIIFNPKFKKGFFFPPKQEDDE